jgi:hypothetical protein
MTMKSRFSLLFLLICALLINCENKSTSPITGTWELIKGSYISSDTALMKSIEYPRTVNGKNWKIITKSHFASIYQDTTTDLLFTTGFNGGTYTFINGIYTENFTHSSISNNQIGEKLFFKAKIEGDKLFLTPCSEDGTEKKFGNFEEYKRLD